MLVIIAFIIMLITMMCKVVGTMSTRSTMRVRMDEVDAMFSAHAHCPW